MDNENLKSDSNQNAYDEYDKRIQEARKQFPPMSVTELIDVLSLTVKNDDVNKVMTFLTLLSAYTEDSQLNLSFNAPSSSGKSFIPLEVSSLFPAEDKIELGYCSAQAFFHEQGNYDEETNTYYVDFERKILLFIEQPHPEVLKRIRPLLSHDKKEIVAKITDKSEKGGNRTKTVIMIGHAAAIFCSAGLRLDEQESTRFLLLSPETTQEKLKLGISEVIAKEADRQSYVANLSNNLQRSLLIARINAIKAERIKNIKIDCPVKIEDWFLKKYSVLQPKHQRDIKRLTSIIKLHALLNLWHRPSLDIGVILATEEDMAAGFLLWEQVSTAQELNLPPYVYDFYKDIIRNSQSGSTIKEILVEHHKIYGRPLEEWKLRREIIPMLQTAGLISVERDPEDRRSVLITPVDLTHQSIISGTDTAAAGKDTLNE